MSGREARSYQVEGRVQGVGFRAFVVRLAREQGVRGGVRNEPDGSVRATVEGDPQALDRFRAGLERGPSHARVERVTESAAAGPPDERFDARF